MNYKMCSTHFFFNIVNIAVGLYYSHYWTEYELVFIKIHQLYNIYEEMEWIFNVLFECREWNNI